jgi:hypothetical protein
VATWKLACEVFEAVVHPHRLSHLGDDPEGERVAPDASEVLAEQVNCPPGIAGGRGADHFDVVAFPSHRPTTGVVARGTDDGTEIGGGKSEARVGADREAQCRGGPARVDGLLRLLVPRGRGPGCGDHTAVDLNRRPGGGQVIIVAGVLIWHWLHVCQAARMA